MQVRYNGEYAREQRSYGCSKCGTGRSISGVETYRTVYRTYYSGRLYIFEQGKTYPVDDILGRYLTNLRYTDKEGVIRNTFTEVPDNTEATYVKDVEDTEFHIPEATKPSEEPKPAVTEEAPKPPVNEPKPAEENQPVTEEPKPSNEADKPAEPKETEEAPKPTEEPKPTPQPVEEKPTTTEAPAPTPEEPKPAEEPKPSEELPVDTGNAGGEASDHLE